MPETCPARVAHGRVDVMVCGRPVKRDGFCGIHAPSQAAPAPAGPRFGLTPNPAPYVTATVKLDVTDGPSVGGGSGAVLLVTRLVTKWYFKDGRWRDHDVVAHGVRLSKTGTPTSRTENWTLYATDPEVKELRSVAVETARPLLPSLN